MGLKFKNQKQKKELKKMKNKINFALKDTDINLSEDLKAFALSVINCVVIAYIAQC